MRLHHALILLFLSFACDALAQIWQVADPYAFNDETVVYASIRSNVASDAPTDFAIGAFVGGECRVEVSVPATGADGSQFFILRVKGDQSADQGKPISFMAYHKPTGRTYVITPANNLTLVYDGESLGSPSRPIVLVLQRDEVVPVALQSFVLQVADLVAGQPTRMVLQPVPSDASFDRTSVSLSFTGAIAGWTAAQVSAVAGAPLSFDVEPHYPGPLQATVAVGGTPVALTSATGGPLGSLEVGSPLALQAGWQWRGNAYGDVTAANIYEVFGGDLLTEVRTQQCLLYNDETWGYFGTLMEAGIAQNTCYKIKMSATPAPATLRGGSYEAPFSVVLDGEWKWVGVPYYYDHPISEALNPALLTLPEGMVIVSKEDGSAEFNGTQWVGDLTVLRSGQGLMVYSPLDEPFNLTFAAEGTLPQGVPAQARPTGAAGRVWRYDASRFMNNTTIVARVADVAALSPEWSVGVLVGDECRGEGHYAGGCFFVTAHTERGERVRLVLRHEPTGYTTDVVETLPTQQMRMGSLRQPLVLHAPGVALGVGERSVGHGGRADYDLTGRRTTSGRQGIVIRRQADGTVRKVLMK